VAAEGLTSGVKRAALAHRACARRGCDQLVKKPTAKYCSVQCCAVDPERQERLRGQARRAGRTLPMSHQLSLAFPALGVDLEAQLAALCEGREDVPAGMSRLAG